jgi:hypothetical protein
LNIAIDNGIAIIVNFGGNDSMGIYMKILEMKEKKDVCKYCCYSAEGVFPKLCSKAYSEGTKCTGCSCIEELNLEETIAVWEQQ